MSQTRIIAVTVLLLAAVALVPRATSAGLITFNTPLGATEATGLPVSAQATFTTGSATLDITLTNLLANPKSVAQNLSDLFFTISTGQTGGSLSSSSGLDRTVASDGTFTDGSTVGTGWALDDLGLGSYHLRGLGAGTGAPAHTIIGPPDSSNVYSNANASIAGNRPHNPFLGLSAAFHLSVTGVTDDSSITRVTFSFGTAAGNDVPGVPPVPEPASAVLLGIGGILGLAGWRLHRPQVKSA